MASLPDLAPIEAALADSALHASAPAPVARIKRFTLTERALHWMHASAFFALLATGMILYLPALSTLISRRNLVKNVHIWVAVA